VQLLLAKQQINILLPSVLSHC